MVGGRWEVVGGRGKKNKSNTNNVSKEKRKRNIENVKIEAAGPIEENHTMFEVFLEKERKESSNVHRKVNGCDDGIKGKEITKKKKKLDKKILPSASKIVSCDELILTITEENLKNILATVEARFPESPIIWLKDLVSFFNLKLDIGVEDAVFASKPIGYPCSMLKKNVYGLLVNTLKQCTPQTLQIFFEFCLQSLIQDIIKGYHTFGYRLVLQCLAKEMPSIITANLTKCVEYRNTYKNRQDVSLSLMWVAGQAGEKSLETGFKVWNELLFPVVGTKTCTNYVVDYLERLLNSGEYSNVNKGIIGVRELFPILDFIHSKDLVANVQKRLLPLYPKLKKLSYGSKPESVLRNYFPSYLRRLEPQCPPLLKDEILKSLVQCLLEDNQSYSVWRQLYVKHLIQSKLLIMELNQSWKSLPSKFPKKLLIDTLLTFQVTNEEMISQGKSNQNAECCISAINELVSKVNSQKFSWFKLFYVLVLILSALLFFDVQWNHSFKDSNTGQFINDIGLAAICEQAKGRITVYSGKAIRLLETYIPISSSWIQKIVSPYFELFWMKLLSASIWIWTSTYSFQMWCNANLPSVLSMLDKEIPMYAVKIIEVTSSVSTLLLDHLSTSWSFVEHYGKNFITWFQMNIHEFLPVENLLKYSYDFVEVSQQCILFLYDWVYNHISSLILYFN